MLLSEADGYNCQIVVFNGKEIPALSIRFASFDAKAIPEPCLIVIISRLNVIFSDEESALAITP
jgi:hypothetical protein